MKVFVRGDKAVNYGRVVELMALLQQNGVDKVGIVTETPE
jgi:biopolymer transport protein TolR